MTTQTGYIYLLGNEVGRYSLERTPDTSELSDHAMQMIHSFPVDDLMSAFYFLAGRFSKCEGAEWEALSKEDVALFKRIRGGSLDSIIADVVLPDRPRTDPRYTYQILSDLKARTWRIEVIGIGAVSLVDEHGIRITPEEWEYLDGSLKDGYQLHPTTQIMMSNWVRCGELVKPE